MTLNRECYQAIQLGHFEHPGFLTTTIVYQTEIVACVHITLFFFLSAMTFLPGQDDSPGFHVENIMLSHATMSAITPHSERYCESRYELRIMSLKALQQESETSAFQAAPALGTGVGIDTSLGLMYKVPLEGFLGSDTRARLVSSAFLCSGEARLGNNEDQSGRF